MEETNKKTIVLTMIGVLTFIGVIIGATYAYFVAQGGTTSTTDVNVEASTTDSFSLNAGEGITLEINQTNFSSTEGSKSSSSTATAKLVANNKTNTATRNYYLYLDITQNELKYTTAEKTPELILTVTDSSNNEVTIADLTKVSVTDRTGATISGYDITDIGGLITILDNKEIKVEESDTDHTTTDTYNITITMVNLDADQSANAGKNFKAQISMQKDEKTFPVLANYITSLYTSDGANGLYKHDSTGTYGEYEAGDNSLRYTGADPNNYVCFGTRAASCPTDNLYRIIGIFGNQMKLIKYDYATSDQLGTDGDYNTTGTYNSTYKGKQTTWYRYYWNRNGSNTWSESQLNTKNLNTNFKKYLQTAGGKDWTTYIDDTDWKVGGNTEKKILSTAGAKNVYNSEILSPATSDTVAAMFGLMYVSDYMYAADPTSNNAWSAVNAYGYNAVSANNWMYMGEYEWTISRRSDSTDYAFGVYIDGIVYYPYVTSYNGVRPVFFLKSTVELAGGSGTASDPYRIA